MFKSERFWRAWNTRYAGKTINNKFPNGYIYFRITGIQYLAHRVAWLISTGDWPKDEIDHINGVSSDNRIANLRGATRDQNRENLCSKRVSLSGLTGASWNSKRQKYLARIVVAKRPIHIGYFDTAAEAQAAYIEAKNKYHPFYRPERFIEA